MPFSYDNGLTLLSIAVSVFGAFTALVMTADMYRGRVEGHGLRIAAAGLSFGLSAGAMQLIALLAVKLPVPVGYDMESLLIAGALPIAGAIIAFAVCSSRQSGGAWLPVGVVCLGASLSGMHYLAMASISGAVKPEYSALGVALATVVAMQAALLTLWLAYRARGVALTFAGAAVIGVAVFAVHYAAMETTTFAARTSLAGFAVQVISEFSTSWMAAAAVYLFCSVCLIVFAVAQFRAKGQRMLRG